MVLTGKSSSPVVLQDFRVKAVNRRPPLAGSHLTTTAVGGAVSVRYLKVDLDSSPPSWRYVGGKGEPVEHFPLQLGKSAIEVFDIQATTRRSDVEWTAELIYLADGEQGTLQIANDGKPFRTTATPGTPLSEEVRSDAISYYWDDGRWARR